MSNLEIKEIDYEEQITEESDHKRLIFDLNKYNKIKEEGFTLKKDKIFNQPIFSKLKRIKNEVLIVSDKEQAIDVSQIEGKTVIPLLSKQIVNTEISKIQTKNITYRNIELAATEIIVKAYFQQGIDTPIELMIVDERIINPIEKSIITRLRGNLIYQKVRFIIRPDYSISLADKNIDKTYTLYYKLYGIQMKPGSKVMSIRCKNAYLISTHHSVTTTNKLKPINIDKNFEEVLKTIEFYDQKQFTELDNNDLQLAIERTNSLRMIPSISSMSQTDTQIVNQFYIKGIIKENNIQIPILLNTGLSANFIHQEYITNIGQVQISNLKYKELENSELLSSQGKINKIIVIASQEMLIEFEIINDNNNKCILGNTWLDYVKPWNINENKLVFTYKNIEFSTNRIK